MVALRMRVSMSAMGSVIMGSPTRLDHAGDLPAKREHSEADSAQLELAVIAASTTAHLATAAVPSRELRPAVEFRELRSTGHGLPLRISSRGTACRAAEGGHVPLHRSWPS